jgi:hypothetical protein
LQAKVAVLPFQTSLRICLDHSAHLKACAVRHQHVKKGQVDFPAYEETSGFFAVVCKHHLVSVSSQHMGQQHAIYLLVVHNQDRRRRGFLRWRIGVFTAGQDLGDSHPIHLAPFS